MTFIFSKVLSGPPSPRWPFSTVATVAQCAVQSAQ